MNESVLIGLFVGVSLFVILTRLATLERRLARLSRLDAKMDALLAASNIAFDPMRDVPIGVREAL